MKENDMICPLANVEEVFQTKDGAVYQCSRKNCYWLEFNDTTTAFKVSDFFLFKKHIDNIDVAAMLSDSSRSSDFQIVMPFRTERCFLLSVADILNLRELLQGAKFMIKINSEVNAILRNGSMLAMAS